MHFADFVIVIVPNPSIVVEHRKRHLPVKPRSIVITCSAQCIFKGVLHFPSSTVTLRSFGADFFSVVDITMNPCHVCKRSLSSEGAITCSGTCGSSFHFSCVSLTKSYYTAWRAKVGFFWFCDSCRLNFEPAVYDRERIILKALRELLIRTDSMDTRLGNYDENLRKINKTLYGHQLPKPSNNSNHQTSFHEKIDQLTLDDSSENTSFFEVLDEVNSSLAQMPEKFVIGNNKRVQIVDNPSKITSDFANVLRNDVSTPATSSRKSDGPVNTTLDTTQSSSRSNRVSNANSRLETDHCGDGTRSSLNRLKVANRDYHSDDMDCFYVTPFAPDQTEEEVINFVADISNAHPTLIKVTKLVPRGKSLADLSFVSFKLAVCKSYSRVVGDAWYWPDGITVRPFELNPKNGSATRLPNTQ